MGPSPEQLVKHLEFTQAAITRMAGNSFLLKGWSVTLVAAMFALAAKDADAGCAALALFPALAFWGLDAYYLRQERLFRKLYDGVRKGEVDDGLFGMNTSPYADQVDSWWVTAWSGTVAGLHLVIVGSVLAVTITAAVL